LTGCFCCLFGKHLKDSNNYISVVSIMDQHNFQDHTNCGNQTDLSNYKFGHFPYLTKTNLMASPWTVPNMGLSTVNFSFVPECSYVQFAVDMRKDD
jgi:hypothetical protein